MQLTSAYPRFQYVFLQLQELRRPGVSSPSRVRQKLKSLPRGLDETYDMMLQRIDESVIPEVRALLMWLAFGNDDNSGLRMTLDTLSQVLHFQPNRDDVVDEDEQLFQAADILKFMPGLVITIEENTATTRPDNSSMDSQDNRQAQVGLRGHCEETPSTSEIEGELSEGGEAEVHPRDVHVRIAHFSVQEYLMSDRIRQGPAKSFAFSEIEAHVRIAQTWLAYHFYISSTNQPQRLTFDINPWNPYGCMQYVYHMEVVPREDWPQELEIAVLSALAPGSKSYNYFGQSLNHHHVVGRPMTYGSSSGEQWFTRRMLLRPHCCTAFFGWLNLTELLLSGTSSATRYLTQLDFDAVLYYAAFRGQDDIVRVALQMGANTYSRHLRKSLDILHSEDPPFSETALHAASDNGCFTTVEILLAHGADINARDSRGQSVLHLVVSQGDPDIIAFFLDHSADVNALDNEGCSVLGAAMLCYADESNIGDWVGVIRLLLDRGADPRSCSESPMTVTGIYMEATRNILDQGANVNQPDLLGRTALHNAVAYEEKDTFRLLLERGAGVNARADAAAPSVLQAACYHSFHGMKYIPDLLSQGADPAAPPGYWGSPIHAFFLKGPEGPFSYRGNSLAMVRMLLDAGADITAKGGKYGHPLQAAVAVEYWKGDENVRLELVELLLTSGADVNAQGGEFGSALQAAVAAHHHEGDENARLQLVELLLTSGADVNAQGGKYGSALQAACQLNVPDLVRLLLGRGADPNVPGGKFGNPLTAAVGEREDPYIHVPTGRNFTSVMEIVELLLDSGARINARGNTCYGTALQAAAVHAPADVVRLLLERGAEVNGSKQALYGSALQAACARRQGDPSVVRLLLEHGADALARGGKYGSAFHAAVVTGNIPRRSLYFAGPLLSKDTLELLLASEPSLGVNDTGGLGGTTAIQDLMGTLWAEWSEEYGAGGSWYGDDVDQDEYEQAVLSISQKVQLLVEHGADINLGGGKYGSPLQSACALDREVSLGRAEMLLDLFPNIEVNNLGGLFGSPLQAAASSGQTDTVRRLLERNADVDTRGGRYGSALNAAILREHWDIVEILRNAGAKADCEIMEVPDQLWLWEVEREEHVHRFSRCHSAKEYGEDAVARYGRFWEVETGKEIPVDRVLEWLFG